MKIEKTHNELFAFNQVASNYLLENEYIGKDGQPTKKDHTKLVTCLKNILKQVVVIFADYNEERQCIVEMNCVVDSISKVMLKNERGEYTYTAEGAKKMRKEIKDLNETSVSLHQRLVDGDFELTDNEEQAFAGLVVNELIVTE